MAPETDKGGTKGAETNKGETNGLLLSQVWFPWSLLGSLFGTIGVPIGSIWHRLWFPLDSFAALQYPFGSYGPVLGQLKAQPRRNQNRNPFLVVKESKLKPFLSYKLKGFGFGLPPSLHPARGESFDFFWLRESKERPGDPHGSQSGHEGSPRVPKGPKAMPKVR